jgi:hypothetical protein
MGAHFLIYLAKLTKKAWDIDSSHKSSKGLSMEQIEEIERRISMALDKIAAGLDGAMSQPEPMDDAHGETEDVMALRAENERLAVQVAGLQSELTQAQADRDEQTAQVQKLYEKLADALNASDAEDA